MRRCCEEALRVLRAHKRSLATIVEVFIHDPLYRWALTPADAQRRQPARSAGEAGPPAAAGGTPAAGTAAGAAATGRQAAPLRMQCGSGTLGPTLPSCQPPLPPTAS